MFGYIRMIPLISGCNGDYTALDATGSATLWKLAGTVGTATNLQTAAAQNNTKTGVGLWEFTVPSRYHDGDNINLAVNVQRNVSAGTTLTTTVDVEVWKLARDGTAGSDICATAAQTSTSTAAADKAFTITGASLAIGDRLLIRVTGSSAEAGNTGTCAVQLNSIRVH